MSPDIRNHTIFFRKLLGAIIIVSVIYVIYGFSFGFSTAQTQQNKIINGLALAYPAPQIGGISTWINSPPLQLHQLKGKVVLMDFWTYSCINCLRTLPYLKDWYQKYHDKGLEIIGVHTPEFDFEKNARNVKNLVRKMDIQYPIALDNQSTTWQNFHNRYWPAHFLIDKNGMVVYEHFGEGEYAATENNIRYLLGLNKVSLSSENEKTAFSQTPETYLGYARAKNFASPEEIINGRPVPYTFPESLGNNQWALQGVWIIGPEYNVSQNNASLKMHFNAGKVFLVMGSINKKPIQVKILLNGKQVLADKGSDVENSSIIVKEHRLYHLITLKNPGDGILQIIPSLPGLKVYAFTFGS